MDYDGFSLVAARLSVIYISKQNTDGICGSGFSSRCHLLFACHPFIVFAFGPVGIGAATGMLQLGGRDLLALFAIPFLSFEISVAHGESCLFVQWRNQRPTGANHPICVIIVRSG